MEDKKEDDEFICERQLQPTGHSLTVNVPAAWLKLHRIEKDTHRVRLVGSRIKAECTLKFIRVTEIDATTS